MFIATFIKPLLLLLMGLHPIHVSVTDVTYNPENQSLEIIHKIFIDDFENAVERRYGIKLGLGTEKLSPHADSLVQVYMREQFNISLNGKPANFEYVGQETDYEAIWIYQEIRNAEGLELLKVKDEVLFDLFDDQRNILHFEYKDQKVSFLFRKGNGEDSYQFSKS